MALGGGSGGGGARQIEAGRAVVRLGVKDDMTAALKRLGGRFAEFGKTVLALTGIGGILGGLAGGLGFKETVDDLAKLNDVAKAFGITGKQASGLFGVLGAAGGEFKENLEGVIQFSSTVEQAMTGMGQGAELFKGLAVTAKEIEGLDVAEQFYAVHAAIRELPQGLQESKLALLGGTDSMKQWQRLLSMSKDDVRQLANDLSISSNEIETAAKASEAMRRAGMAVTRAWQQAVIMISPLVTQVADYITKVMKGVTEWMKGRSLQDLWDEGLAWLKVGWTEASVWVKNGLSDLWDFFKSGWNSAVLVAKDTVADFSKFLTHSMATAAEKVMAMVKTLAIAFGPLFPVATQKTIGNAIKIAEKRVAEDAQKTREGADLKAAADKKAAMEEFDRAERALKEGKGQRDAEGLGKRVGAWAELILTQARIALNRAAVMEEKNPAKAKGSKLAGLGKTIGTFGGVAGSFLTQGFGSRTGDPAKEVVRQQKLTVEELRRLNDRLDQAGPLVLV